MEKDKKIGALLGLTQEHIAMLLQITRSQWSLYVIGKRSLPIAAKLKLAEMLTFTSQLSCEGVERIDVIKNQQSKIRKFIEEQLIINKHKQYATEAKLNSYKKKYEEGITAFQLADFLAGKKQETAAYQKPLLDVIKSDAIKTIEKNGLELQEQYSLKLQVLQHEELLLKERLRNV